MRLLNKTSDKITLTNRIDEKLDGQDVQVIVRGNALKQFSEGDFMELTISKRNPSPDEIVQPGPERTTEVIRPSDVGTVSAADLKLKPKPK
jgi:hypothetical protein